MAVFNLFQETDNWSEVEIDQTDVLFIAYVLDEVFELSEVRICNDEVKAVPNLECPRVFLNSGPKRVSVVICQGMKQERQVSWEGIGDVFVCEYRKDEKGNITEIVTPIPVSDYEKYKQIPGSRLEGYPTFNERLLLCERFIRNVDPEIELIFQRPIPVDFLPWFDLVAGSAREELGYSPR